MKTLYVIAKPKLNLFTDQCKYCFFEDCYEISKTMRVELDKYKFFTFNTEYDKAFFMFYSILFRIHIIIEYSEPLDSLILSNTKPAANYRFNETPKEDFTKNMKQEFVNAIKAMSVMKNMQELYKIKFKFADYINDNQLLFDLLHFKEQNLKPY